MRPQNKHYGKNTVCSCMLTTIQLRDNLELLNYAMSLKDNRAIDVRINHIKENINEIHKKCNINMSKTTPILVELMELTEDEDWTKSRLKAGELTNTIVQILLNCE